MTLFLDANVPMYAAGGSHSLKEPCREILTAASRYPANFVTDSEVLQEIMHRYRSINRWDFGRALLSNFAGLMYGRVEPVLAGDVRDAGGYVAARPQTSSRDQVHIAVMQRIDASAIVSADEDFDRFPGVTRLDPRERRSWLARIES